MAETSARQITGDDVISELLRNVEVGLFKARYTVLLPCRFNVYLQQRDFGLIAPVADVVRQEAKQALNEYLDRLNKVRRPPKLIRRLGLAEPKMGPKYKILEPDWSIEFHEGEEDRLRPGEIEIYSDLGTAQALDLGSGAKTTFVTRHSGGEPFGRYEKFEGDSHPPVFATLRYTDRQGEKVFAITKEEIVVGRGGKAVWVDLRLEEPLDISREHCRIRRDPASGRFFLKDLSQYGTSVNGDAVPASIDRSGGGGIDRNLEVPLPKTAKIALADVIVMHFEARPPE
jgi:hypothetical protein